MNQQLSQLLEKLANKLGTTTEYLWCVLLRQSRISASITLFYFLFIAAIGFIIYKLHRKFIKEDSKGNNSYYHHEELAVIMTIASVLWGIGVICCAFSLSNIFNGYFNPEYWALKEILDSIK